MLVVGLTGGIGSGKSTVAALLADRGAVVIDADRIARQVVEPGRPAYQALVDRFGPSVVQPDGTLDRAALANLVFNDGEALAALNAITHPAIRAELGRQVLQYAADDRVVVLDVPLLAETTSRSWGLAGVIVVDVPEDVAVERLVRRGLTEPDARARMRAQTSRQDRNKLADVLVDNSKDREWLKGQVDRVWEWVLARQPKSD